MIRRVLILSALSALAFVACSSENISSSPTENNKITCDVIVDTDSALVLKIVVPDSGSVINDFSLTNNIIYNIFLWKQIIELEKNTPQSSLDQACIKANANDEEIRKEFKDRNINATVTTVCEENVIENTVTINNYPLGKNPIPLLAAPYVYECNEIQRTGKFPEDDDEE